MLLDRESYLDNDKLPILLGMVEELLKQDLSKFSFDVGEYNAGITINWRSIIIFDVDGCWQVSDELAQKVKHITDFTKTVPGINRITINFLEKHTCMPIHIDNEEYGEYDFSGKYLNIILPVTSNGWSVVDYKLIKNKRGEAIMFSGQVPHGAMNDTNETRVSIYLIVEKSRFKNDDTE
jgi:hypothetical protein